MGFKISKIKRGLRHYMSMKAVRKKLGLTGKSRHIRQFKRSLKGLKGLGSTGSVLAPVSPVSANSYYHQPRTLSQMTGGV